VSDQGHYHARANPGSERSHRLIMILALNIRLGRPSGVCEAVLQGHTGGVGPLAVLPYGRLASERLDKTMRLS